MSLNDLATRNIVRSLAALIGASLVLAILYLNLNHQDITRRVDEIYSMQQSYDGEIIDNLIALGPNAIPEMAKRLGEDIEFPIVFVIAMASIGDNAATAPILGFLEKLDHGLDSEQIALSRLTIRELEKLDDPRKVDPLLRIMTDTSTHPVVRLSAATTIASTSNQIAVKQAQKTIMDFYNARFEYLGRGNDGFALDDLLEALTAANTEESIEILVDYLYSDIPRRMSIPIIKYFANVDNDVVVKALSEIAFNDHIGSRMVRLEALSSLVDLSHGYPKQRIIDQLEEIQASETVTQDEDFEELANSIKSRVQ